MEGFAEDDYGGEKKGGSGCYDEGEENAGAGYSCVRGGGEGDLRAVWVEL